MATTKSLKIVTPDKKEIGSMTLPDQFGEDIRPDLIRRAVEAVQSSNRQPYGTTPRAGKGHSAKLSRRRRKFRGSYGHGISRVPRKIMSRNGERFTWVGAFAPGTVGGRKSFPPVAERIWTKRINDKERKKAIRSALAATIITSLVNERGHKTPIGYPFIIDASFETITTTKNVAKILDVLGLGDELSRAAQKSIRAGKGGNRGRPYKKRKGPLLVVSKECPLLKAARNIPGIDVVAVTRLNAELLAPGTKPGRLTLFTNAALEEMKKKSLYT